LFFYVSVFTRSRYINYLFPGEHLVAESVMCVLVLSILQSECLLPDLVRSFGNSPQKIMVFTNSLRILFLANYLFDKIRQVRLCSIGSIYQRFCKIG
jgi:hypothetical protein